MINIGYKEKGTFNFSVEGKKPLFGEVIKVEISHFNERFMVFPRRGESTALEGFNGLLSYEMTSSKKIKFRYWFVNNFKMGTELITIKVNGVTTSELPILFYHNQGVFNYSQSGDVIKLVIEGVATDIEIDGEKVSYYKMGNLTFAEFPFQKKFEVTYKKDMLLYSKDVQIEDNRLELGVSSMVVGNHNYTASLYTHLSSGKRYKFVEDGVFYRLNDRYETFEQINMGRLIFGDGKHVDLELEKGINHFVVKRGDKYNPLTLITK